MSDLSGGSPLGLSAWDNLVKVRQLIRPRFHHDIHGYTLEAICKAMDGFHVISVVKTGGGKTTIFSGFMVLLQELEKLRDSDNLKQCVCRHIPDNPLCIIVYPTKGLREEMADIFNALGIPSLAINEDTIREARTFHKTDLWTQALDLKVRCLLLSPEQLTSKSFTTTLSNSLFYSRIIALNVDEIHLILSWGATGFRKSFRDIGNALMRLPRWTTFTGVTATLASGADSQKITQILGFRLGSFVFTRRSNKRPELQFIFCTLRHGLQKWLFPDLDWILDGRRKTIIYCRTISLAFCIFVYITSRDMFVNDSDCQVMITTDALKVGNDFPNIDNVVVIDPEDPSNILQKGGCVGRRPPYSTPGPCCICYFTEATISRAKAVLKAGKDENSAVAEQSKVDLDSIRKGRMTLSMARLILAHCINAEINSHFSNPVVDCLCACETCSSFPIPTNDTSFRYKIWDASMSPQIEMLPPAALLPDSTIGSMLDQFVKLKTLEDISSYVNCFLSGHEEELLDQLQLLRVKFNRMKIGLDPNEMYVSTQFTELTITAYISRPSYSRAVVRTSQSQPAMHSAFFSALVPSQAVETSSVPRTPASISNTRLSQTSKLIICIPPRPRFICNL
ncbi:P-loop containing nucleoside triphosphate hydrolase protein [Lentinula aff. detonsa]|nr:P-loop containing nucleoside triphosphate hydrolase protein [Lentinula aff. detonsa]